MAKTCKKGSVKAMKQVVLGAARFHVSGAWPATWTPGIHASKYRGAIADRQEINGRIAKSPSERPPARRIEKQIGNERNTSKERMDMCGVKSRGADNAG